MNDLLQQFKKSKSERSDELNLRLHRSISWLTKAEQASDDLDIEFITLWISFNAVYAKELPERGADRASFIEFLNDICRLDTNKQLYELIWKTYPQSIRVMLDNRYIFQPFWDYQNGKIGENIWQEDFAKANKRAFNALAEQDTHAVLMVIFDRLYTLRNQIVHGGATYESRLNRSQLKDGCQILLSIIPSIIQVILNNPTHNWGKPFYPVVT